MMRLFFRSSLVAVSAFVLQMGVANAALINVGDSFTCGDGTQTCAGGSIPDGGDVNDFLNGNQPDGLTNPLPGIFNGVVSFSQPANLVIDYFGAEAGYKNSFELDGMTLFTHNGGTTFSLGGGTEWVPIQTALAMGGPDPLDFLFNVNLRGTSDSVANGEAFDPILGYFVHVVSDSVVYLFLDDGGAGPDDNHDDMVIRITATAKAVPEPLSLALVGLGLAGLAVRRR